MLTQLKYEMIQYERGCPSRIQHFLKVHSFAKLIGEKEGLDEHTLFILESTALVHDIGIKNAKIKYGSSAGPYQEKEGEIEARPLLEKLGYDPTDIDRICYLVGHHHTYNMVDGIDYQILLEADYLVNSFEHEHESQEVIYKMLNNVFKTKTGKDLLITQFDLK